ncbi:MAG: protein translocase subunit SecD, partial [Candidatus Latescibacteria bacterium]|nr:protein translocase subunit SecD [Candidatus Latescibacterota bacterium]NIM65819.1 protein translocase subunit SecD [Candidatus Latescibacterota bacterium]NIO02351.1 protein translocase subunit SecD [Candidatus Latescibacterota bacterium]NIT02548.1 protein translocase subunit SecD [Candidatus Latescibacterota bacterium]NIT39270.1 protein translocase subunit SecD [Candidatus Latescibacterota bacterium]
PSLGRDSIQQGIISFIVGGSLVILFMIAYYQGAGLLANAAVIFNVLFLLAILAGFKAVLTLPGIAGIVLTVGMAVDANVLINERIREELR